VADPKSTPRRDLYNAALQEFEKAGAERKGVLQLVVTDLPGLANILGEGRWELVTMDFPPHTWNLPGARVLQAIPLKSESCGEHAELLAKTLSAWHQANNAMRFHWHNLRDNERGGLKRPPDPI
jgi:hypothetical protein